jgi:signal transduction histidine kinase
MTERFGYVLETLREGAEFTYYRGRQHGRPLPVLVVALTAAASPSPQSLRRLEHEYSLEAELDPAWASRPLALTHHEGRTILVLEDPGGVPLDRILDRSQGQPMEPTRFLRIAIGLATALGQAHRRGLIHKDIKPANILVDMASGCAWLTGFGIASRLPRERQAPETPEVIAGTLAYMAPEQTGRMNRSIDSRSDLYALGVTFYEILTGTLPFKATDPMGWVHCHIARQADPPCERAKQIPEVLSTLVMKLLAKALGFVGAVMDVTEVKETQDRMRLAQAEREQLEQRLRQAEKMEAVGRLAGGIAHDFNNVLAGIFAYGEMLFEETPPDSPLKRYSKNVLTAATRGRALVEQILAYSRSQLGKRAPVDVAHVVAETLELLRGSLPADMRLEASAPELPLMVIGDATQLHQVVMNVCSNAIQAMNAGGTLRVALEAADLFAERALSHGSLAPGRYVRLTIQDSGSGMEAATLARIFEPFFTTKEIGRGTGLGLSLVYAIVTDAGGAIDVHSALEQGSTFDIYLARTEAALVTADEAAATLPRGRGERVLLVEDEASLLALTAEVLERLGYEPVSFSGSQDALAAFEVAPRSFDVVITDDFMPGLSGTGLAMELRRRRPDLPIVLMSGHSGPTLSQQALAAGVSELLVKPLQSRRIAIVLDRVLHHI